MLDDDEGYFLEDVLLEGCLEGRADEVVDGGLKSAGAGCNGCANASIISGYMLVGI